MMELYGRGRGLVMQYKHFLQMYGKLRGYDTPCQPKSIRRDTVVLVERSITSTALDHWSSEFKAQGFVMIGLLRYLIIVGGDVGGKKGVILLVAESRRDDSSRDLCSGLGPIAGCLGRSGDSKQSYLLEVLSPYSKLTIHAC